MASVYNRGSRDNPMWYARVKHLDGKWRGEPTNQPNKTQARRWADQRQADIDAGKPDPRKAPYCSELFKTWSESLTNRSADDDRSRLKRHVAPAFGLYKPNEITLPMVMQWIDKMRATTAENEKRRGRRCASDDGRLSDATIRHNLNLLSRFFSWAVERGHAAMNPVRLIPTGKRPHQSAKDEDKPWIDDDKTVRDLMHALPLPYSLMFYIGNRAGLRRGEILGLRMSDLGFLAEGVIRVRFSYDGCLKEDKRQEGKTKWAPAPDDIEAVLGEWLTTRKAQDAKPEDYLFPYDSTREALAQRLEDAWNEAAVAAGQFVEVGEPDPKTGEREKRPSVTFYEATRHSFVSRNLARGVSLDEVSSAIGHSSPVVTQRYYNHFVRRQFSAGLRSGVVGANGATADVVPFRKQA